MNIGIFGLLTIVFTVCKLAGVIDWSWWLVMSPLIAGACIGLCALMIALCVIAKSDE